MFFMNCLMIVGILLCLIAAVKGAGLGALLWGIFLFVITLSVNSSSKH